MSVTPAFLSFSTPASMPGAQAEVELDVGLRGGPVGVPEAAGLEEGRGDRAALEQEVLHACPDRAVQLGVVVVGVVAACIRDGVEVEVVLEVRADAGQVVDDRHADRPQVVGRADAGQQQQARRADAARGDQHLALAAQHDRLAARVSTTSTPTARPSSTTMRVTRAPVLTVRFGRSRIGLR